MSGHSRVVILKNEVQKVLGWKRTTLGICADSCPVGVYIFGHLVSPKCQGYSLGLVSFSTKGLYQLGVESEKQNHLMTKDKGYRG